MRTLVDALSLFSDTNNMSKDEISYLGLSYGLIQIQWHIWRGLSIIHLCLVI